MISSIVEFFLSTEYKDKEIIQGRISKVELDILKYELALDNHNRNKSSNHQQNTEDSKESTGNIKDTTVINIDIKQPLQTTKEIHIQKYGYLLAKYKHPKEFGIYNLSPEELGKRYERYIGYLYEKMKFKVDFNGITKRKEDRGIDIIAKKKNEIYVIQCKRYGKDSEVHENTIHQLYGVTQFYKSKNSNYFVFGVLYTANDNLDLNAREVLEHFNLKHIVEPHPLNEDYPLVKCNISDGREKIYHLPGIGMYDRIKIEYNKGECYVETENDAIALGFRKAKT